jgi:hypothetical protein
LGFLKTSRWEAILIARLIENDPPFSVDFVCCIWRCCLRFSLLIFSITPSSTPFLHPFIQLINLFLQLYGFGDGGGYAAVAYRVVHVATFAVLSLGNCAEPGNRLCDSFIPALLVLFRCKITLLGKVSRGVRLLLSFWEAQ